MITLAAVIVTGLAVWLVCEARHAENLEERAALQERIRRAAFVAGYDERDRIERINREKRIAPQFARLRCGAAPVALAISSAAGLTLSAGMVLLFLGATIAWRLAVRALGLDEEDCDGPEVPSLRVSLSLAVLAILGIGLVYASSPTACSALLELVRPELREVTFNAEGGGR